MPPTARHAQQTRPRKGHYSCEFCRVRKLRCSRPLPCINCVSRGKTCVMDVEGPVVEERQSTPSVRPVSPPTPAPKNEHNDLSNRALLDEVHRLRRLAEDLERRITHGGNSAVDSPTASTPLPTAIATYSLPSAPAPAPTPAPDTTGPICAVVTHLDRVSMGNGSYPDFQAALSTGSPSALSSTTTLAAGTAAAAAVTTNGLDRSGLAVKIEPILAIPTASEYTYSIVDGDRLRAPRRCVYLPLYRETTVFVGTFLNTVSSFYHIVHHPTVLTLVTNVYDSVQRQQGAGLALGDILLVLSMIATGTYLYSPPTSRFNGSPTVSIFASRDDAARQTPYWIQAALYVLEAVVRGRAPPTLSAVQGVVMLSFLISNVEGVGFRYRYIVSTALLLGRELGLHCIDQEHTGSPFSALTTPVERELGRRTWWYLASTDWLLAARNSGPGVGVYQTHPHMMRVREPCNIDDAQLQEDDNGDAQIHGLPMDVPTDMSYYLQRIRLAKVARGIVDRMPMVSGTQFVGGGRLSCTPPTSSSSAAAASLLAAYRESAIASDAELDAMLRDLPPFLRLETYEQTTVEWTDDDDNTGHKSPNSLFIQAFMLHSLIHTQRCKLHLSYLTSWRRQTGTTGANHKFTCRRSSVTASSTTSRDICIEAARQIIHAETQLRRRAARHPFVQTRLSCVLYGVFLATIVLLIDLCADNGNGTDAGDETPDTSAAFAALQIVDDARPYSAAAAELYISLTQLLAKHQPQLLEEGLRGLGLSIGTAGIVMTAATTTQAETPVTPATATTTFNTTSQDYGDPSVLSFNDALYANPLALHFDGLDDLAQFQWDDLLAGVDTTMFV